MCARFNRHLEVGLAPFGIQPVHPDHDFTVAITPCGHGRADRITRGLLGFRRHGIFQVHDDRVRG